jgi:flavin reductase (DIM6/NTAB) family NADH-FMN oxidoreductase RutF
VTVVSYRDGGRMRGATVNSFTSLSIDPPLLLVALARSSRACAALAGIPFAVNVLRSDQLDVALQFAGRARPGLNIAWDLPSGPADPPTLSNAIAVFRCRRGGPRARAGWAAQRIHALLEQ